MRNDNCAHRGSERRGVWDAWRVISWKTDRPTRDTIILTWIFEQEDTKVGMELIWLRTETNGR
jgi:hypothetical protein